jgi:hypothetical protein
MDMVIDKDKFGPVGVRAEPGLLADSRVVSGWV